MRIRGIGLKGKFVIALLISAALPFLLGLLVFESASYKHLLAERGKLHQMEALTLARALNQASHAYGEELRTWITADPTLIRTISGIPSKSDDIDLNHLDEIWPSLPDDDPRLLEVLNNNGSVSLKKYQNLHPEVAEVMATGAKGCLVAATGKTSDYLQADEDWWQTGATLKSCDHWSDVLRFDASSQVFSLDVVTPLYQDSTLVGVAKMSIDVTSTFSKLNFRSEAVDERWDIVLPDGWILASSKTGFKALTEIVSEQTRHTLQSQQNGWSLIRDLNGEVRMAGFIGMGPEGKAPNAHILFSSKRDDAVAPIQRHFLYIGLAAVTLLVLCLLAGFHIIHNHLLKPLQTIRTAVQSIAATARYHNATNGAEPMIQAERDRAEADLDRIKEIRTGDEIESFAEDLAVMSSGILRYHRELEGEVTAQTSLIREDLKIAHEFQTALLPTAYPVVPPSNADNPLRLQFAHFYQPAETVGGDFFDLIELDENRVGVLIADVMSHGARSALITAILRALVKNQSEIADKPGEFLTELNRHLHEIISRSGQTIFVTAFFLVLDTRNSAISWSVAGHPAPMRVKRGAGRMPEPLWTEPQQQPALGLIADATFRTEESPLAPGEVFLLFTGGTIEAENPEGERFGTERLITSFDQALDGPLAALPAKVVCDVNTYQKSQQFEDDVCLVVVEAVAAGSGNP